MRNRSLSNNEWTIIMLSSLIFCIKPNINREIHRIGCYLGVTKYSLHKKPLKLISTKFLSLFRNKFGLHITVTER